MISTRESFIPSGEALVAAKLEVPARPHTLVVLLHGFTSDLHGPGGLQRRLADALIDAGCAVARLDARGCGDSWSTGHPTVSSMRDDVVALCGSELLVPLRGLPLVLTGISLGGMAVALAAPRIAGVAGVVAVSSDLSDGDRRAWPPDWSRRHEHTVSQSFMEDLAIHRPREALLSSGIPVACVVGDGDRSAAASDELRELGFSVEVVTDGDHLFQDPTSEERLAAALVASARRFARDASETRSA